MKKATKITLIILKYLLLSGGILLSAGTPYFFSRRLPRIIRGLSDEIKKDRKGMKRLSNTFYHLKNRGYVNVENKNGQVYISLTEEGKRKAGKYQIDDLQIKKPRKWDKNWRILIFDIKNKQKIKREALRGKIKELGLYQLQKSVWVYPHNFNKEIKLLKDFFEFNDKELIIIEANKIHNDEEIKNFFSIKP